jgi:hypothetical protein
VSLLHFTLNDGRCKEADKNWRETEVKRRENQAKYELAQAKHHLTSGGIDENQIQCIVAETADVRESVIEFIASHKIDAIVCGTRDHGVVKRALLGNVSSYLTAHANTTVIIARSLPPAAAMVAAIAPPVTTTTTTTTTVTTTTDATSVTSSSSSTTTTTSAPAAKARTAALVSGDSVKLVI